MLGCFSMLFDWWFLQVLKEHRAIKTFGTTNPLKQYHIMNDFNPQPLCCGNLKSHTYRYVSPHKHQIDIKLPYNNSSSSSSSCSGRIRFDFCSLYPQNQIGPSISSSVVLRVFVLLVYIVVLVLVSCLCPSSVCVVATFPGTVLFPLLYSLLLFFP